MYPTIFNQSLLSIASITLIFLLKLFHYTISLLLIFLIHSFSYSSSIQILLSSIPKTIQPNYLQTTPIHFHLYHNPPQYTLIHFPREPKSKKKSHKARPTLYSPSSLSILETRRKLQILFLHRIAYPPWNELDPTSASLDKPLFCW